MDFIWFQSLYNQGKHFNRFIFLKMMTMICFNPFITRVSISTQTLSKHADFLCFNPFITRVSISTFLTFSVETIVICFNPFITRVSISTSQLVTNAPGFVFQSLYNQGKHFNITGTKLMSAIEFQSLYNQGKHFNCRASLFS